ncbi:NUDIX domain-containing protein, partial [Cyanobium sp. LEGE 06143]|uniref:NUDIX domain-containing protein n=1 Tax=Cyanobium sp. LEGE 06143 TaxID=945727 RepID=UPI001D1526F6
ILHFASEPRTQYAEILLEAGSLNEADHLAQQAAERMLEGIDRICEDAKVLQADRLKSEELAIEVQVGEELIRLEHAYSHKRLRFVVHLCRWSSGEPQPLASQQLRWVRPEQLADFPFPAANARIIAALQERLARGLVEPG